MTLQTRLMEDLKRAMREGDEVRRSVLRMLRSAVHYDEIARGGPLDDEGVLAVISRQVRQRKESIAAYREGNRADLVSREEAELAILLEYRPQQLSQEELLEKARRVIQEVNARGLEDKGKVMGLLMPQIRGQAEGAEVNAVVTELLQEGGKE